MCEKRSKISQKNFRPFLFCIPSLNYRNRFYKEAYLLKKKLEDIRLSILKIDEALLDLYRQRLDLIEELIPLKKGKEPIYQPLQEQMRSCHVKNGKWEKYQRQFIEFIMNESCRIQLSAYPPSDVFAINPNDRLLDELKGRDQPVTETTKYLLTISKAEIANKTIVEVTDNPAKKSENIQLIIPVLAPPLFFRKNVSIKGAKGETLTQIQKFLENLGATVSFIHED